MTRSLPTTARATGRRAGADRTADATAAPRQPSRRTLTVVAALVGLLVALVAAAGIPVRATNGAQVTADEPQYLLSALSLAEDRDLNIADELAAERWRAFHEVDLPEQTRPLDGGRRLSPHNPLLPLLLAVPVGVGGWVGAKLALAAMAGLLAGLLVVTAVRRLGVGLPAAAAVVGLLGCSPPLAVYGGQVYPEVPAALAVTGAVLALTGPLRRGGCTLLGVAVVALPWLGVKYAPVAAVLAVLGVVRLVTAGASRRLAVVAAGLALAGAAYAGAHLALYGGLTPYAAGDHFVGGQLTVMGATPNYAGRSVRLAGLLTDARFGLAAWQPAWLLLLPALAALVRRRPAHWPVLLVPLVAGWLTATFVALTMHGWWWPGRQVVVVLPAAVLALAWWVGQARPGSRARWVIMVAAGLAGVLAYGWLVVEGLGGGRRWVVDFWATGNPVYQGLRLVLPDFQSPDARTWWLHAVWVVGLLALAAAGWVRSGSSGATVGTRRGAGGAWWASRGGTRGG